MVEAAVRLKARGRLRAAWDRLRIWAAVLSPSIDIRDRVRMRQIASLIRQTNVMGFTNLVNSALITVVLWDAAPRPYLLGWAGLILVGLGVLSGLAERTFYGRVDADGVLQESFFLPLSFLLGFVGVLLLLVAAGLALRDIVRR